MIHKTELDILSTDLVVVNKSDIEHANQVLRRCLRVLKQCRDVYHYNDGWRAYREAGLVKQIDGVFELAGAYYDPR